MSNEKRLILFLVLSLSSVVGIDLIMRLTGLGPKPRPPAPAAVAENEPGPEKKADEPPEDARAAQEKAKPDAEKAAAAKAEALKQPKVEPVEPGQLVLGSTKNEGPQGYLLQLHLAQNGAGVESIASARFEAEFEGKNRHLPMQLLVADPKAPPSLAITLPSLGEAVNADAPAAEIPLDQMTWEVVRDDQNRIVRPIPADAKTPAETTGSAVVFRTSVGTPAVTITKTYRLRKGANGFEMDLSFSSPEQAREVVYKLIGPHGIPIEGEWYTGTFRDVYFGQLDGSNTKIVTKSAYDIAKAQGKTEHYPSVVLKFAGIENQYFALFVEPSPVPKTPEDRWETDAYPTVIDEDPNARQKADVGLEFVAKPVKIGPNQPFTQSFKIFAGPKTADALVAYEAEGLALYRKGSGVFFIPFADKVAGVIVLEYIYQFTTKVAHLFGGKQGNYGISIILLTLLVRLCMFPLGRKQALAAKKMQDLQPLMKELQAKYKDDKEQQTRETFALYKRHGVNPVRGCLPALIQLPIFVGLWQALNTSSHLRHASFLYIQNLAAPDMLFRFPIQVPLLGQYFNLLPFLVVTLMLIQTKLFAPPATTPEAEMQQKMMKYMMVGMAFMFYKVPSGLGIYFITSSLWQISERLLLPKVKSHPIAAEGDGKRPGGDDGDGRRPPGGGNGPVPKPPGRFGRFLERVMAEAKKDPTYRKMMGVVEPPDDKDRDRGKSRSRSGRRR